MSLLIDQKYALSLPLDKFERKNHANYFANFRCPICNDSQISSTKKRAWFYTSSDQLTMHCFNCGYSNNFHNFLKTFYPYVYDDYIKESYLNSFENKYKQRPNISCDNPFQNKLETLDLNRLGDLPSSHDAIQYTFDRKLPLDKVLEYCYYTDNFYNWCKEQQPDNFQNEYYRDRRIVFPFRDRDGNIFGASGRSIDNKSPKYLTIKFVEDIPKVYGYDKLNIHKKVYVTEGQIDSLFIDNCIGVVGALGGLDAVCDYCNLLDKKKVVLVTDNERRNKYTCDFMKKNLEKGYSVVLFPTNIKEKDINQMVVNGMNNENLMKLIDNNTVFGLSGLAKLASWRKS